MRYLPLILLSLMHCASEDAPAPRPQYASLAEYPVYAFADLGATYSPAGTTFKLWSPGAQAARLHLYTNDASAPASTLDLVADNDVWTTQVDEDLDGTYYTFQIKWEDEWLPEATDPYARAAGTNGLRGQIVDLEATDPEGWDDDDFVALATPTDAVIYELHVRDLSIAENSGIEHKGKFLGLAERGTTLSEDTAVSTGLDHLVEMGVTHVHLLPSFDYLSVDEARLDTPQYNWGYDPQNYNVPEGSYSTDPSDGKVRIREFKQMVSALHDAGIGVVMDVVYNHTGRSENSKFQHLVPDYFYRFNEDGTMSNASGCGNEIASERPMVRKYIRESVAYWMREFHVDGFRFDLMGIHDIATMNEISKVAHEINPDVLLYGEGWTAGSSPLPDSLRALKVNTPRLDRVAAFSDDVRDALKGSVFDHEERGFVSGANDRAESVKFGIVGATRHPQIAYDSVNYSSAPWAPQPTQCVNYVSCHDNHTLYDRILISNPDASPRDRERMQRLALATVLTSQGIPFLHAGTEFLRSKEGNENSYNAPDEINAIRWAEKQRHAETVDYVRNLIALRRTHPAFRLGMTEAISKHLTFIDTEGNGQLIAYRIQDAPGDGWTDVIVVLNGDPNRHTVALPEGNWRQVVNRDTVDPDRVDRTINGNATVEGVSANIYVRG